jgi:hypothetical protein
MLSFTYKIYQMSHGEPVGKVFLGPGLTQSSSMGKIDGRWKVVFTYATAQVVVSKQNIIYYYRLV